MGPNDKDSPRVLCRTQHSRQATRKACRDMNEAESPWSSWPCDSFGQNQEGGDRERALWFDEPVHQRSQERHPDLVVLVVERDTPDEMLKGSDSSGGWS